MTEDRLEHREICDRLTAIETTLREHLMKDEAFVEKYGSLIDLLLIRETGRVRLRQVMLEKLAGGGVWLFVGFLLLASWEFIKKSIR